MRAAARRLAGGPPALEGRGEQRGGRNMPNRVGGRVPTWWLEILRDIERDHSGHRRVQGKLDEILAEKDAPSKGRKATARKLEDGIAREDYYPLYPRGPEDSGGD